MVLHLQFNLFCILKKNEKLDLVLSNLSPLTTITETMEPLHTVSTVRNADHLTVKTYWIRLLTRKGRREFKSRILLHSWKNLKGITDSNELTDQFVQESNDAMTSISEVQRLINLEIPILVRSLKSSNVELG